MKNYDFLEFKNVEITGINMESLNNEELAVLYAQARYCQAMTDADIPTMRSHLLGSLDRLQTDYIDLYYLHRMSGVPVEKVAEAMGRLIDEGLIRGRGLSQVDVDVIDRAQAVTPLAAIQNIYYIVERDSEAEIIPYCMENNIGFVPLSPIASGLLSGKITP